jgi:hypothetical protein
MRVLFFVLAFMLSSCDRYVKIPAALTQHCTVEDVKDQSIDEAVRVAVARKKSLEECNRRLDTIQGVEGSLVKGKNSGT